METLRIFWRWLRLGRGRPRWRAWRDAGIRGTNVTVYRDGEEIGHAKWAIFSEEDKVYVVEVGRWTNDGIDSVWTSAKAAHDRVGTLNAESGAGYAHVSTFVQNKPDGEGK